MPDNKEPTEPGTIQQEVADVPNAIRKTFHSTLQTARDIASALRTRRSRRIFITGNGTSFHTCLAAAFVYRLNAGPSDPLVFAQPAGEFRHYLPELEPNDAVIAVSASGEFRDVLAIVEQVRQSNLTIGIVHVADSTLAQIAEHVIVSSGGPSHVPVMTKTFAATLTATYLLLLEVLGGDRAKSAEAEVLRSADVAETALADFTRDIRAHVDELAPYEHIFVYGGGGAFPAALEVALKLKEIALVHAEGSETWEMASGGATIVGHDTLVIALAPNGTARSSTDEMTRHCAQWGARILEVAPSRAVEDSILVPIAADANEALAPLYAAPPVVLLAYELALRRGATPDVPHWAERYRSQGMTHILGSGTSA